MSANRISDIEQAVSVRGSATFVLVHGAWGSGASWNKVACFLSNLGHSVYAPDLPGHGADLSDIREMTAQDYTEAIIKLIRKLGRPVILVGSSMGGAVISRVAEAIPEMVEKLVYSAAFLLTDGMSCNGIRGDSYAPVDWGKYSLDGGVTVPAGAHIDANRNNPIPMPHLVSQEARANRNNGSPLESVEALHAPVHITKDRFGSVRRFYVMGLQDRMMSFTPQMLQKLPCEKLYKIETDHMPQLSTPTELAFTLHMIAKID